MKLRIIRDSKKKNSDDLIRENDIFERQLRDINSEIGYSPNLIVDNAKVLANDYNFPNNATPSEIALTHALYIPRVVFGDIINTTRSIEKET